jgi:hypothetical protein
MNVRTERGARSRPGILQLTAAPLCAAALALAWIGAPAEVVAAPAATPAQTSQPASRLQRLAPDFAARAERARKAAAAEPQLAARAEISQLAALLERATEVEADRVELARKLAALEQRLAAAVSEEAAAERAHLAAQRERAGADQAAAEQAEAEHVFAALANGRSDEMERSQAFLLRRARLLLSAANALGADSLPLSAASQRLDAVRAAPPAQRFRLTSQAHGLAALALGTARRHAAAVSPAERLDLRARASERGFEVDDTPEGLTLRLPSAFARADTHLRASEQRRLQLLSEVLPAYPHGGLRIACGGAGLVRARQSSALQILGATAEQRARLIADPVAGALPEGDDALLIVLPAYATPH